MYDYLLQKGRFRPASMYVMYVTSQFHVRFICYVEVWAFLWYVIRFFPQYIHFLFTHFLKTEPPFLC